MSKDKSRPSVSVLKKENAVMRAALQDTLWMARRYATGRRTYAPGMYNDRLRELLALGLSFPADPIDGTIWARDGDGHDGLTEEHFQPGHPIATGHYLGLPEKTNLANELVAVVGTSDILEVVRRVKAWKQKAEGQCG